MEEEGISVQSSSHAGELSHLELYSQSEHSLNDAPQSVQYRGVIDQSEHSNTDSQQTNQQSIHSGAGSEFEGEQAENGFALHVALGSSVEEYHAPICQPAAMICQPIETNNPQLSDTVQSLINSYPNGTESSLMCQPYEAAPESADQTNQVKPDNEGINDGSNETHQDNNSIGTWQGSEKGDSDIEVWTKPSTTTTPAAASASLGSALGTTSGSTVVFPGSQPDPLAEAMAKNPNPNSYLSHNNSANNSTNSSSNSFRTTNSHILHNPSMRDRMNQYYNQYTPFNPSPVPLIIPPDHTPTWQNILPLDYFTSGLGYYSNHKRRLTLSLINVWEFTIAVDGDVRQLSGLRGQIKKIAREHVGQGGRKGAVYEREGIVVDDPQLKIEAPPGGGGKWRIPLGAYQALLTYLTADKLNVVEGIPLEQLRAATLGRERYKKDYPSAEELIKRGVHKSVANALAPYQRGGVDFILEKEGRALLADEMGLGKTVQAIAAMSAYRKEWPVLILCPSSARYHWEVEVRHWLSSIDDDEHDKRKPDIIFPGSSFPGRQKEERFEIKKESVNVVTSGKSHIFRHDGQTKVVICSYGLITSMVNSGRIKTGMFNAVIVDESHALKNKSSKRTIAVLPLLKSADRCLLLSGTPALARPSELWPQISVLGGRRKDGLDDHSGIWIDEDDFNSKYVRGEMDEGGSKARLAELHTLLTSTVMIRRMKADILKNLQPKIREKAYIDIKDVPLQNEFRTYMQKLRQGRGVMGKFAREHHTDMTNATGEHSFVNASSGIQRSYGGMDEEPSSRDVLHHLYKITGKAKIAKVTHMLRRWLADPSLGKLCIFAHHLDVLDEIGRGAGLNNSKDSTTKYIRIDGATMPKTRQEQILSFQTDPTVRVALLGITAAGVAVTLTASSTVWFAELFWTPAIMIQAEDRCHRIGQQARVRCLYFIARGTLDEILWKLIEKKFRDLGEFVEGRENMDIALERELEEDEDAEILKVEAAHNPDSKKRKSQDDVSDFFDLEDAGIKEEISELVHEEEDMLRVKGEEDDDELDTEEKTTKHSLASNKLETKPSTAGSSKTLAICLSDEEEREDKSLTVQELRDLYKQSGVNIAALRLDHSVRFNDLKIYKMQFRGQRYGFNMLYFKGRAIVKEALDTGTHVGAIIVAVGRWVFRQESFDQIRQRMKNEMANNSPVTLTFADDSEFIALIKEEIIPRCPKMPNQRGAPPAVQRAPIQQPQQPVQPRPSETIDLLDDDDDD